MHLPLLPPLAPSSELCAWFGQDGNGIQHGHSPAGSRAEPPHGHRSPPGLGPPVTQRAPSPRATLPEQAMAELPGSEPMCGACLQNLKALCKHS